MSFGYGFRLPGWYITSGGFTPAQLFTGGVQGAWYDPSDLTTLFQDSAGTTPVTAVEQPVGLMLDKSKGLVLGSELATNGGFDTDTAWTKGVGCTITGGRLIFTSVANNVFTSQSMSGLAGETYAEITIVVASVTAGQLNVQLDGGAGGAIRISIPGTYTYRLFKTLPNNNVVYILAVGTTTAEIESISVKKIAGNHAYQTTSASRPTLRARYNLLTYSEQFDNAAWVTNNTSISTNAIIAPDGSTTGDTLTENSSTTSHSVNRAPSSIAFVSSTEYVLSVYAKNNGRRYLQLYWGGGGSSVFYGNFDLQNGIVGTTGFPSGAGSSVSSSITDVGGGWYRCVLTLKTRSDQTGATAVLFALSNSASASSLPSYTGDGTSGIYIWGAQLTQTAVFPSNTYQRIGASTDYATGAAFPPYLFFDGTDDSMLTNSVDFSATDKMLVVAGVTKNADVSIIAEFSANAGANNGAFLLATGGWGAENGTYVRQSRGTATAFAQPAANSYPSPRTDVLTGTSDIAGDSVVLRINGTQVATSATDQGTGNYGNYPMYIGRRNNASLPLNGNIYSLIIAGQSYSSGQISSTESWVAAKTPLGTI